jgi:MFS transporter, YNFM family, putative membrane transport protein
MPEPSLAQSALRSFVTGLTAFLTVVDLFETQAILPSLVKHYQVSRAAMGLAVNASTIGMAVAGALAVAGVGLPLPLLPSLTAVLAGLALVGVGTFFAQAAATGFIGRAATADRGSASGIYLACYFFGGIVGTAVLGQLFDRLGWSACVGGIAVALALAALLALRLKMPAPVVRLG